MERLFTKLIVNLITIVISSVGFTLSVMAHCLAGLLPFVVNGSNTQIIHTSSLTVVAASLPDTSEGETAIAQQVVSLQLGDAQVNFRTSVITALRHKARKASLTTAPVSPPLTNKAEHSENSAVLSPPSSLNGDHATCETEGCSEGEGSLSLVFRKRQGSSQAQPIAGPSNPSKQQRPSTSPAAPQTRSRSTSPRLRMLTMKPREPEEPADAHGRIPYVPNPNGGETFQTGFVNPFKGKGKSRESYFFLTTP
ncbi:hypothetical protein BDY19DRAFT_16973 [Irpex rosettiformis]|uniref:Uncharacterized protein n=1 Tax=Irpex rosettiformis TaxID=378272 RepID=A0ACB8UJN2_9APHY|nr:hypothetical protein BDY19DRAFT_16973 [Irpex rosettiformis]